MEDHVRTFMEAADQLEQLKKTLRNQQDSSQRLSQTAQAIEQVAVQISRVPSALEAALERIDAAERRLDSAIELAQTLQSSVPGILEQIAATDMGQSVAALNEDLKQGRTALAEYRSSAGALHQLVEQLAATQREAMQTLSTEIAKGVFAQLQTAQTVEAIRREMLTRLDGLESRVTSIAAVNESAAAASLNAFTQATDAIRSSGTRQGQALDAIANAVATMRSKELDALRVDLSTALSKLEEQSKLLEVISKRKGLVF